MNSPYMGKFQMTQTQHPQHDGYDLVGIDSKEIHATVNGTVCHAGWENSKNHSQGFGRYVCIEGEDGKYYYYGHLSQINVKKGKKVKCTDVIGVEGSTGYSTGSHCHYCVRKQFSTGNAFILSEISGIPNALGTYDDGYRPDKPAPKPAPIEPPKSDLKPAFGFDKGIAGAYKVTASALNVRKGSGMENEILTTIPNGKVVQCYGYYNDEKGGRWLLIQFEHSGKTITGYSSSEFLVRA